MFAESDGSRFVWVVDVLPNELAGYIGGQMDLGMAADEGGAGVEVIPPTIVITGLVPMIPLRDALHFYVREALRP